MNRRAFIKLGSAAAAGVATAGCLRRAATAPLPTGPGARRAPLVLTPVHASFDRIIRTTTGLRPYRPSGFVLRADRIGEKLLVHNYGHGGAGWSLSWGTAAMATELALERPERRAAVIGAGIIGITTARELQRHGFDVTVYARALSPDTTSNKAWAAFTPNSGLVSNARRTPEWDAQFRRAIDIAYQRHQLLVGNSYGVSWIDEFGSASDPASPPTTGGRGSGSGNDQPPPLLPASVTLGRGIYGPGEHPFSWRFASRMPNLRFEPSIYLDAVMKDFVAYGGRIVIRSFAAASELGTLAEPTIVNCTGLGSRELFGDSELTPVKGQLTVLVPQDEVNYIASGMLPRRDGIVLGHVMQRGVETLDVDLDEQRQVVERAIAFFGTMRLPGPEAAARREDRPPLAVPPVEAFLDRIS